MSRSAPLLRAASVGYGAFLRLRNRYYDRPGASRRASIPVLSVGNLTVGGTGKTPVVAWLAERLLDRGLPAAVVSRGYRGTAGRGPLVVSAGNGPVCPASRCGDEPYLLAERLAGVVVIVGSDRWAGAEAAARAGAEVVVLDDGFQHRRLARDLDIVLLDARNPFDDDRVLPAGRLREPLSGIDRADFILVTRSRPDDRHEDIERVVRRHNPSVPILPAGHRRVGFFDGAGRREDPPRRAVAFCGIGNPESFRLDLAEAGVDVVAFEAFRDHHAYTSGDYRKLRSLAARLSATLVTTEKDLVRLPSADPGPNGPPIVVLRIAAEIFEPAPLLAAVRRAVERKPAP